MSMDYDKAAQDILNRNKGGGTTSTATASKSTSSDPVRNEREKYLIAQSPSVLATLLKQGQTDMAELKRILPESKLNQVLDNTVTAAEMAKTYNVPGRDIDSFESQANVARGLSTVSGDPMNVPPSAAATPSSTAQRSAVASSGGSSSRASGGGGGSPSQSAAPTAGIFNENNGRPFLEYQGQRYVLPQGATADDPRVLAVQRRLASGDTSGAVVANTANDVMLRGGTALGKATILNGQQYRSSGVMPQEGPDGKWYLPGSQTPFASEAAARAATPLVNTGAALTSRLGNSPTARAAGQGGFTNTFAPGQSNFDTIGLDEIIAAGATKGNQRGDILGTMNRAGYPDLDITLGGISEGGGLTPVGNPMDPYSSFTGQVGNTSIGMSSILGNSGVNTQYWLSQMSGLPPSEIAKLKIDTPEEALQFEQVVSTLRQNGTMPNFASLYALNEDAPGGAFGGNKLIWDYPGSGNTNTPYDKALSGFMNTYMKEPDLTYLPDTVAPGMSGGQQPENWWLDPAYGYKKGGQFMLNEPSVVRGLYTGDDYALLAEGGKQEKVTISPTQKDISMGRERMTPLRGGQPVGMASGGEIWGGSKGWVPYGQPEEEPRYDYSNAGPTYAGGYNINIPGASASGQPVQARLQDMGVKQVEPFLTQNNAMPNERISGALVPTNEQQPFGNAYLPVYTQANPKDYSSLGPEMGAVTGYQYVPTVHAGTTVLVKVPQYGNIPRPRPQAQQNASQVAYLTRLLSGNGNTDDGLASGRSYGSREAALAALYDLDPKAAMLAASQGGGNTAPWGSSGDGMGGRGSGQMTDAQIEQEARRRRQYDINARNYSRAGMPSPTIADIPRQVWNGEGPAPWGNGPAPYVDFQGGLGNGYITPFDYFGPNATGGSQQQNPWRRGMGGGQWWQNPQWYQGRGGRPRELMAA